MWGLVALVLWLVFGFIVIVWGDEISAFLVRDVDIRS